jgi:hypothetical protein
MGTLQVRDENGDIDWSTAGTPTPPRPAALKLAEAFSALAEAERNLTKAMSEVPDYTAQWSSADYYSEEQEDYNRAADAFADAIKAAAWSS